jgi:hypothetical protein
MIADAKGSVRVSGWRHGDLRRLYSTLPLGSEGNAYLRRRLLRAFCDYALDVQAQPSGRDSTGSRLRITYRTTLAKQ